MGRCEVSLRSPSTPFPPLVLVQREPAVDSVVSIVNRVNCLDWVLNQPASAIVPTAWPGWVSSSLTGVVD